MNGRNIDLLSSLWIMEVWKVGIGESEDGKLMKG
jgi:hypothetical protein